MKKFLLLLFLLVLPSLAGAQEGRVGGDAAPGVAPKSWLLDDIFHRRADICQDGGVGCEVDNVVDTGSFAAHIRIWVPITQFYQRLYLITDVEGALVAFQSFDTSVGSGFFETFTTFTLSPGVYKFYSLVIGANGQAALSDPFRFRVCC